MTANLSGVRVLFVADMHSTGSPWPHECSFRIRSGATNYSEWEETTAVVDELGVCRGLEVGVMAMTPGSSGVLTVESAYAFGAEGSEKYHVGANEMVHIDLDVVRVDERPVRLNVVSVVRIYFAVTLTLNQKPYNLSSADRLKHAQELKAWGNDMFRAQDFERALRRYEHAAR